MMTASSPASVLPHHFGHQEMTQSQNTPGQQRCRSGDLYLASPCSSKKKSSGAARNCVSLSANSGCTSPSARIDSSGMNEGSPNMFSRSTETVRALFSIIFSSSWSSLRPKLLDYIDHEVHWVLAAAIHLCLLSSQSSRSLEDDKSNHKQYDAKRAREPAVLLSALPPGDLLAFDSAISGQVDDLIRSAPSSSLAVLCPPFSDSSSETSDENYYFGQDFSCRTKTPVGSPMLTPSVSTATFSSCPTASYSPNVTEASSAVMGDANDCEVSKLSGRQPSDNGIQLARKLSHFITVEDYLAISPSPSPAVPMSRLRSSSPSHDSEKDSINAGWAVDYLEQECSLPIAIIRHMRRMMHYSVPLNYFFVKVQYGGEVSAQEQQRQLAGVKTPGSVPPTPVTRELFCRAVEKHTTSTLTGVNRALTKL